MTNLNISEISKLKDNPDYEWINVNDRLPLGPGYVLWVKRESGEVLRGYYHQDQIAWIAFYTNVKRSHFQDKKGNFLHDVVAWARFKNSKDPM